MPRVLIRNYVKLALRRMLRHPVHAAVNIVGLAAGIACCLLIFAFVRNELAVDDIFPDADRIYRVGSDWASAEMGLGITAPAAAGETLAREYVDVEDFARLYLMSGDIRVGDRGLRREIMMADPSVIRIFDLPLLRGDARTALGEPRSALVSEELAREIFGTVEVVGRTLQLRTWQRGEQPYTITGVLRALPYNSITYFGPERERQDVVISPHPFGDFFEEAGWTSWGSRYILQFVKLSPGTPADRVRERLGDFLATHAPAEYHGTLALRLDPLQTLYLDGNDGQVRRMLRLLGLAAAIILLLAAINFTNLSTARALTRAREVGVRKVIGAKRSQLGVQFLCESILTCAVATMLGAAVAAACLDSLLQLTGRELVLERLVDPLALTAVAALAMLTGAAAGAYPAFVLSSFRPIRAFKGLSDGRPTGARVRQALVLVQFAAAVVLLVSMVVVSRQLAFMADRDLGFATDNVLVIDSVPRAFSEDGVARMRTVRAQLEAIPGVASASLSWRTAAEGGDSRALHPPENPAGEAVSVPTAVVDEHFARTYRLRVRHGRIFAEERPADSGGIVLNATAARLWGWEDGIEGRSLVAWPGARAADDPAADPPPARPVIGVVEDYHFESLHRPIGPLAFVSVDADPMYRVLSLRLTTGVASHEMRATIDRIRRVWEEALPGAPFEFTFMDDQIARAYSTEKQMRVLAHIAAGLAVVLAALGMLGLASISTAQRTKEAGIRKVMGATATQIMVLLSADILKPVGLAILIGCPIGYLLMHAWLEDYAYRIELSPTILGLAAAAGAGIAITAVGYHVSKAALANPADTLRYE